MALQSYITNESFYRWLGITELPIDLPIKSASNLPINIGAVRALFCRLCHISSNERQQVVAWGLWVEDVTIMQMLNWCKFCINSRHIDSRVVQHKNISLNFEEKLRVLLFAPCAVIKMPVVDANSQQLFGVGFAVP